MLAAGSVRTSAGKPVRCVVAEHRTEGAGATGGNSSSGGGGQRSGTPRCGQRGGRGKVRWSEEEVAEPGGERRRSEEEVAEAGRGQRNNSRRRSVLSARSAGAPSNVRQRAPRYGRCGGSPPPSAGRSRCGRPRTAGAFDATTDAPVARHDGFPAAIDVLLRQERRDTSQLEGEDAVGDGEDLADLLFDDEDRDALFAVDLGDLLEHRIHEVRL
jgi:hypothetical protein